MNLSEASTENLVAFQLGAAICEPNMIGLTPVAVLPEGFEATSLEKHLPAPTRSRGITTLRDQASFVAFVKGLMGDATTVYGRYNPPQFLAVFNDTTPVAGPGWQDHRAQYDCPTSVEWNIWKGSDGKRMAQADFAQFIESNLPDINSPPAADMLEISRSLEAKKKVDFASGIRLSNGQNEITYTEEITGTAQKGKLSIPEIFTLGIAVLEGGTRYAVQARLRYRIDGGKLQMWYELVRPHKILEDAVNAVWSEVSEALSAPVLNGAPA